MKKSNDCHPEPLDTSGVKINKTDPLWLKEMKRTGIPPVESPHRDKKSWPEDAQGHKELDPDYGSYLTEDAEKVFWCPFYDCSMCESKCANRRTRSDLWELCFLCDEGALDIKAERERLGLTIPELAMMSKVTGKTIREFEEFPSQTIPPQPRLNTKGIVINKQARLLASKTISKLAKTLLRQRDLANGIEKPMANTGFTTPKIVCDCCGHLSAPIRTGETAYPICSFCFTGSKRIAETDPFDYKVFIEAIPKSVRSKTLGILIRAAVINDRSSTDGTCVFCLSECKPTNTKGRVCDSCENYLIPLSKTEFEKRLQEAKDYNPLSDEKMLQHKRKQAFKMVERNLQVGLPLSVPKGHRGIPDGVETEGLSTCNVCKRPSFVWSGVQGKFIAFKPAPDAIGYTCGSCIGRGELTPVDRRLWAKERAKQERIQKSLQGVSDKPKAKKKRKRTKGLSKQALKHSEPLRLFMAGLKKTQKELAEDIGIPRTAISKMLRGIQPISTEVKQYMKENH